VLLQAPPPADAGELGLRVALSVGELPEEHYQVGGDSSMKQVAVYEIASVMQHMQHSLVLPTCCFGYHLSLLVSPARKWGADSSCTVAPCTVAPSLGACGQHRVCDPCR
jgi:hypothetical protein